MNGKPLDKIRVEDLHLWLGKAEILKGLTLSLRDHEILSVIGSAGSGKTTFLRCLNRLTDLEEGLKVEGRIHMGDLDIFDEQTDLASLRRRISMVFAVPTPLPMSIRDNLCLGLRFQKQFRAPAEITVPFGRGDFGPEQGAKSEHTRLYVSDEQRSSGPKSPGQIDTVISARALNSRAMRSHAVIPRAAIPPADLLGAQHDYLAWLECRGLSPGTLQLARYALAFFIAFLKNRNVWTVEELTKPLIEEYRDWTLRRPHAQTGRPLSTSTRAHHLQTVRVFCGWLYDQKRIWLNPAAALPAIPIVRRLPRVLTEKEMEEILSRPDTGDPVGLRDRTILEILYTTGIRLGEVAGLELYDVDLTERVLRVRRGKGGKGRALPLGKTACAWMARYLQKSRPLLMNRPPPGRIPPGDAAFWRAENGERLRKESLSARVRIHVQAVSPGGAQGCHAFRHAFATHMMAGGAQLRLIQDMLGHADICTTEIYTRVKPMDLKEAHRKHHPRGKWKTA